jgi:hypothetical protein
VDPTKARRLMRRLQHVRAVEQLDAGAYGYLISRTALLHPQGETFDVSIGLRGLSQALTAIAAQPQKDFGELVRQRRRKRGLPVTPPGKFLPFPPAWNNDDPIVGTVLDAAAETALASDSPNAELRVARVRLTERRMKEALLALEEASLRGASAPEVSRLEQIYAHELAAYRAIMQPKPPH